MPTKDTKPPHFESMPALADIMLLGVIRNPRNPLEGLKGAKFTAKLPRSNQESK